MRGSGSRGAPTPPGETRFDPKVLRAFGEVARLRFGLARMERNPVGLARRLSLALTGAQVGSEEASTFIRTLRDAPDSSPRVQAAADAITNRETWFFRDHAQLERVVAAAGERCARQGAQSLRVLSAGCATGEEPLSVAMLALDAPHLFLGAAVEVTGFDVSPFALEQARGGQFRVTDLRRAESGPAGWEGRFFRQEDSRLVARSWLSGRVKFELHNLLGDPSRFEAGGFDLVLCRNVLIYFDQEAATRALNALCGWVRPGGQLVLGTAEAGLLTDPRLTRTPVAGAFLREDVR